MEKVMAAEKYKDYMLNLINRVIDEIGPRPSCGEEEKKFGKMLAEEWKPICDKVEVESFTCSPAAFLGFLPFAVAMYIIALPLYWFFPPAALVLVLSGFIMLFFEFMRYKEFVDFLFPKKEGINVTGTIKPKGEVKRRLIIGGHMDSAYEFNIWYIFKNASVPIMIVGMLAILLMVGATIAKNIVFFTGGQSSHVLNTLGIICVALSPIVALFSVFHTYKAVPGAMDDVAGVAVAAGVGKYLEDAKKDGSFFPDNTEVVLYGVGAEEAGLRGSRRYIAKHLQELKAIPTYVLMFDGIFDENFFTIINREICTGAKHSSELIDMAKECASARGKKLLVKMIPLGASDASEFSNAGIHSTCILCQNCDKLAPNYHTRLDTPEKIRPESLTCSLQLALDVLERIDKKA